MRINGRAYDANMFKGVAGYVMQDDLISAELTVHINAEVSTQ
jgi:uncharacterized membrane protein